MECLGELKFTGLALMERPQTSTSALFTSPTCKNLQEKFCLRYPSVKKTGMRTYKAMLNGFGLLYYSFKTSRYTIELMLMLGRGRKKSFDFLMSEFFEIFYAIREILLFWAQLHLWSIL